MHFVYWLTQTNHAFMLLLDSDMVFAPDTLERLRAHGQPYVSGYYMRRRFQPIAPVWFEPGPTFPLKPWTREPERDRLHLLGASGWGCVLIHREVAMSVAPLLKGEQFVIEDDMDIYPYNLPIILQALGGLQALVDERPAASTLYPALKAHVEALQSEIRPLRIAKDSIGSDIRFPFFARLAGFQLMGDANVRPGHMLNYPVSGDDYSQLPAEFAASAHDQILADYQQERARARQIRKEVLG